MAGLLSAWLAAGLAVASFVLCAAAGPRSGDRALLAAFVIGAASGVSTGQTRRAACTAALRTGDAVAATGMVAHRAGAAGRGRYRLRLRAVALRSGGRSCGVPALLTRATVDSAPPAPGTVVRVTGEWMRFADAGDAAGPRDPGRHGQLTGQAEVLERARSVPLALRLRARAARRLEGRLPPDVAPTALALLLAERDEVDPDLRRRFVEAGLAHLLAISGMHIGLLAAGTVWLLGLILGARSRMALGLVLVAAYVGLIGAPPAARRALVVFACYTWGRRRGWPIAPGEILGAALLAAIVSAPGSLLDPGLQLSFAGFAGVVGGARCGRVLFPGGRRSARTARAAMAGAGALLLTVPITALHFGQTSPVALASHFVGGPLVGIGLGSLAATIVLPGWLATPAVDVATGTLRALHAVADAFSQVPGGHRIVNAPAPAVWLGWLLLLEGVRRTLTTGRSRSLIPPAVLAAGVVVVAPAIGGVAGAPALLCTLSVGQGDAAVMRTGAGNWLVFDGGPAWGDFDAGTAIIAPFLKRRGARRVELAVLSHPDLDHIGGLIGLLVRMPVDRVLDSGDPVPSERYASFLAALDARGIKWIATGEGDRFRVDDAEVAVLGPPPGTPSSANATSLSFRLTVAGEFRYLNTGDAGVEEELALLRTWPADSIRADLLKVGHHGSRSSSAPEFLRAVAPAIAVVSSGAGNRYGHPHPEVLDRLDRAGVDRVWRTDHHGTLCVEIDREGRWRVEGEDAWRTPDGRTPP